MRDHRLGQHTPDSRLPRIGSDYGTATEGVLNSLLEGINRTIFTTKLREYVTVNGTI
jgi:hypothetical protein